MGELPNINKRFLEAIKLTGLSGYKVAKRVEEITDSKLTHIRSGRNKPSQEMIDALVREFPDLDRFWIMTGEKHDDSPVNVLHESKTVEYKSDQDIPLYDIEATAGVVSLFKDPKSHTPIDTIRIPNMPNCDGAISVTGDSMYPLIKSGDIVLYKSISEIPESVFFGNMYLVSIDVEGDEMVMVKYVQRGKDADHILLVSENKHHADKEVHIKNINGMALVKASVRFNSLT